MSLSALALFAGRGADRGDLPHLHRAVPRAERVRRGGPAADGEGHRADRGVAAGPPGAGRAPRAATRWRSRTGSTSPRFARGPRLPGYPRPADRWASSAGSTSRARACRCCSTRCAGSRRARPELRLLVVGRGDAAALRRAAGPAGRRGCDVLGAGRRRDQGGRAALGGRVLRAQPGRRELRHGADRGDGGRRAGAGQRPGRVPRPCWTGPGVLFPTGDADALAARAGRPAGRPGRAGRAGARPGGARAAAFDWPVRGRRGGAGLPGRGGRRSAPGRRARSPDDSPGRGPVLAAAVGRWCCAGGGAGSL